MKLSENAHAALDNVVEQFKAGDLSPVVEIARMERTGGTAYTYAAVSVAELEATKADIRADLEREVGSDAWDLAVEKVAVVARGHIQPTGNHPALVRLPRAVPIAKRMTGCGLGTAPGHGAASVGRGYRPSTLPLRKPSPKVYPACRRSNLETFEPSNRPPPTCPLPQPLL